LPGVVTDDALFGIISIGDVVKHHVAEVKMEATAMREFSPWRHPPSAARVECRCITIKEHVASQRAGKRR